MKTQLIMALCTLLLLPISVADELTQGQQTVAAFEKVFGITPGKRRNHTKGFCFSGRLVPTESGINQFSSSQLFTSVSKVIGRLSHKGGHYRAADNQPAEYGLGLKMSLGNGETHMMSMNTLDFFPVSTPSDFLLLMKAKGKGAEAVKAFLQTHPELQNFKQHMASRKKPLTPYEGSQFNSINSFYLLNSQKKKTPIRWSLVPSQAQSLVVTPCPDFFYENLQANLNNHGVKWDMIITIANPNDAINNAAIQWTGEHQRLHAATLVIDAISREEQGRLNERESHGDIPIPCTDINYDPLVLAQGFTPSEDPLLHARRNAYAISFGKRISEKQ